MRHFAVQVTFMHSFNAKIGGRDVVLSYEEGSPLFNPQESLIKHPEKTEVSRKEEHPK